MGRMAHCKPTKTCCIDDITGRVVLSYLPHVHVANVFVCLLNICDSKWLCGMWTTFWEDWFWPADGTAKLQRLFVQRRQFGSQGRLKNPLGGRSQCWAFQMPQRCTSQADVTNFLKVPVQSGERKHPKTYHAGIELEVEHWQFLDIDMRSPCVLQMRTVTGLSTVNSCKISTGYHKLELQTCYVYNDLHLCIYIYIHPL